MSMLTRTYITLFVYVFVSTVISVRIRKDLKEKARRLGINVRQVVEKALEESIKSEEKKELISTAKQIKALLGNVDEQEWLKALRESRDER
jgi:Post-segregation antitoxin CcdA.